MVRALERAPRYRAAYDLLLKIVDTQAKSSLPAKLAPEAIGAGAVEAKKESP